MNFPTLPYCPDSMRQHVNRVLAGEYDPPPCVDTSGILTVLDIGANVGAFTAWALSKFPHCSVTAYEPHPANVELFEMNADAITDGDIDLHPCAVWSCDTQLRLSEGVNNCGEHGFWSQENNPRSILVECEDAGRIKPHDFVKIDAECSEGVILQKLDLSKTQVVALEWHSQELRQVCHRAVTNAGLELVKETPYACDTGVSIYAHPSIINRELMSKPKVFVALPVYGNYHAHFVHSLMRMIQEKPFPMVIKPNVGDSLVSRSRNVLAAEFLKSDCTHLLFIDTDLIFSSEQMARLVSHDKDIVAGLYPKKQKKLAWVANLLEGEEPQPDGLQRIKYAGTGCLLIARKVLERMIDAHPEIAYHPDSGEEGDKWDFFSVGVHKGRYLSEDWFFCQRALDLGFDIWADTRVVLKHVGEMVYPLDNPFDSGDKA